MLNVNKIKIKVKDNKDYYKELNDNDYHYDDCEFMYNDEKDFEFFSLDAVQLA